MKKIFSVSGLLLFLATLYSLLATSFSYGDEITIRAIITPIGSQTEKWGAVGMMVCVAGEEISEGGCGTENSKAWGFGKDGNKVEIEIKQKNPGDKDYDKLIFFTDTLTGTPPKGDHQFTHGEWHNKDYWDTVYEVRGEEISGSCVYVESEGGEDCYLCRSDKPCPAGYTDKGILAVEIKSDGSICHYINNGTTFFYESYYKNSYRDAVGHCIGSCIARANSKRSKLACDPYAWYSYGYFPKITGCSTTQVCDTPGYDADLKCWLFGALSGTARIKALCDGAYGGCEIGSRKVSSGVGGQISSGSRSYIYDCTCATTLRKCCK